MTDLNLQERSSYRLYIDRIVRWLVSIGGVGILMMLLLMFVFLFTELYPIFSPNKPLSATLSSEGVPFRVQQLVASSRDDELYAQDESGRFIALSGDSLTQLARSGDLPYSAQNNLAVNKGRDIWQLHAFGTDSVQLQHLDDPTARNVVIQLPVEVLDLNTLEYVANDEFAVVVGTTNEQIFTAYYRSNGVRQTTLLQKQDLQVDKVSLSASGDGLLMWGEGRLTLARLEGASIQTLTSQEQPDLDMAHAQMIPGSYGFISQAQSGVLSYWSLIALEEGFELKPLGNLSISRSAKWSIMHKHRTVLVLDPNKGLLAWQLTSQAQTTLIDASQIEHVWDAIGFRYLANTDSAYWWSDTTLQSVSLSEYRPTLSPRSVFGKVWYDGFESPEYVWQTSALADNYESKLSVVPLVFGTIKAAVYAMLFAIPVAIGGAIYTAYFMSSGMRAWVKPTIELMEALPTVIIAFLAGVWFAPLVDENLISIGLFLLIFPLLTLLASWVWSALPSGRVRTIPSGLHLISIVPIILVSLQLSSALAPSLESVMFGGDVQSYLANNGITYDLRNSVIVGIAMGFAVVPTIFTLAEEAIFAVPRHLSQGAFALGATKWQALRTVVLQTASAGIVSAVMVGLGRAVGETMIVLMATGNTPVLEWNIFEGMRSLASAIAIEMPESEVGSSHYQILILSAFLLLVFTFLLNSVAALIRQRLNDKYRSL